MGMISLSFSSLILLMLVFTPFTIGRQLFKHFNELPREEMIEKYGSLYQELSYRKKTSLLYYPAFTLRRLLLIISMLVFAEFTFV